MPIILEASRIKYSQLNYTEIQYRIVVNNANHNIIEIAQANLYLRHIKNF